VKWCLFFPKLSLFFDWKSVRNGCTSLNMKRRAHTHNARRLPLKTCLFPEPTHICTTVIGETIIFDIDFCGFYRRVITMPCQRRVFTNIICLNNTKIQIEFHKQFCRRHAGREPRRYMTTRVYRSYVYSLYSYRL